MLALPTRRAIARLAAQGSRMLACSESSAADGARESPLDFGGKLDSMRPPVEGQGAGGTLATGECRW